MSTVEAISSSHITDVRLLTDDPGSSFLGKPLTYLLNPDMSINCICYSYSSCFTSYCQRLFSPQLLEIMLYYSPLPELGVFRSDLNSADSSQLSLSQVVTEAVICAGGASVWASAVVAAAVSLWLNAADSIVSIHPGACRHFLFGFSLILFISARQCNPDTHTHADKQKCRCETWCRNKYRNWNKNAKIQILHLFSSSAGVPMQRYTSHTHTGQCVWYCFRLVSV